MFTIMIEARLFLLTLIIPSTSSSLSHFNFTYFYQNNVLSNPKSDNKITKWKNTFELKDDGTDWHAEYRKKNTKRRKEK